MSKTVQHMKNISVRDEYGTPLNVFKDGCKLFGFTPKVDVCTNHINAKCPKYYTKEDDALSIEWKEPFFMNPPYSQVGKWMDYAMNQWKIHGTPGLILTFAKTDTKWFAQYIKNNPDVEISFITGRIRFNDESGEPTKYFSAKTQTWKKGFAPYGSMWIYLKEKKV